MGFRRVKLPLAFAYFLSGVSKSPGTASFARRGSDPPEAFFPEAGRAFVCAGGLWECPVYSGHMG